MDVRLATAPLSAAAELEAFLAGRTGDGAVVSFTGLARGVGKDGSIVETLTLDWYPGMTERSMREIAEDAAARFAVSDLVVVHRCGDIVPGETIVFVAAAAAHRRAAFAAADYLMDRLKTEAAFWKRETGPAGVRWIEPLDEDRAAAARWKDKTP
ncbi:MAG: molybdenum cofactor biosynthesis protein MoaE [Brevundimonas sp.]|nr:molybdenum cofactor biosynthesis protein MoaE [Brevundimonas sp.]MDO9586683.1 molybdenum cofactor biosynthesis protein MoaE [Brevundimonas sp.]MDP3368236.1 molybdenum cofactor biosynthesis protein MoaE [Brevundimonas sp.]MDP3657264.1 molybdenum cofactor biosynthesis protein MoaE [Brevundimonas sp.]MDZ4111956.1 molybdenum cofactor biosynthesis protein MoaE [Brevundimonas sp.]